MPWGIRVASKGRVIFKTCHTKHKDLWDFEGGYWKNF
jgi:hypothetical protein